MLADAVHCVRNPDVLLEELERVLFVTRIVVGQDQRHLEHVLAVEGHPGGPVGLLQGPAGGKRCTAVEYPDVVETQKSAREYVVPLGVFAVGPPVEVEREAVERTLQK